jgi:hypothetical protein
LPIAIIIGAGAIALLLGLVLLYWAALSGRRSK